MDEKIKLPTSQEKNEALLKIANIQEMISDNMEKNPDYLTEIHPELYEGVFYHLERISQNKRGKELDHFLKLFQRSELSDTAIIEEIQKQTLNDRDPQKTEKSCLINYILKTLESIHPYAEEKFQKSITSKPKETKEKIDKIEKDTDRIESNFEENAVHPKLWEALLTYYAKKFNIGKPLITSKKDDLTRSIDGAVLLQDKDEENTELQNIPLAWDAYLTKFDTVIPTPSAIKKVYGWIRKFTNANGKNTHIGEFPFKMNIGLDYKKGLTEKDYSLQTILVGSYEDIESNLLLLKKYEQIEKDEKSSKDESASGEKEKISLEKTHAELKFIDQLYINLRIQKDWIEERYREKGKNGLLLIGAQKTYWNQLEKMLEILKEKHQKITQTIYTLENGGLENYLTKNNLKLHYKKNPAGSLIKNIAEEVMTAQKRLKLVFDTEAYDNALENNCLELLKNDFSGTTGEKPEAEEFAEKRLNRYILDINEKDSE